MTDTTALADVTFAGSIHKASGGFKSLPVMEIPNAAIGDSLSNPRGSRMCSGFFELKAGEALTYEYTYDEMKVVIAGEFILTDMATGETVVAGERDILFFPKGTTVKFETKDYALGCFTGDRDFPA